MGEYNPDPYSYTGARLRDGGKRAIRPKDADQAALRPLSESQYRLLLRVRAATPSGGGAHLK
jgi:hypothetical protein